MAFRLVTKYIFNDNFTRLVIPAQNKLRNLYLVHTGAETLGEITSPAQPVQGKYLSLHIRRRLNMDSTLDDK